MTDSVEEVGSLEGTPPTMTPVPPERPSTPPDPQLDRYRHMAKTKRIRFGSQFMRNIIENCELAEQQVKRRMAMLEETSTEESSSDASSGDYPYRPLAFREEVEHIRSPSPLGASTDPDGGNEGPPPLSTFFAMYDDAKLVTTPNVGLEPPKKFPEQVSARLREPHANFTPGERPQTRMEKAAREKARESAREFAFADEALGIFIDKDGHKKSRWKKEDEESRERDIRKSCSVEQSFRRFSI